MASEFTQYYNLDKYTNSDKPNLRDQYNSAMDKIDAQLHVEADNITVAVESANLARDKANEVADNLAKTTEELTKELGDTNTEVNAVRTTAEEGLTKATANSARIQKLEAETANMDAQLEYKITQETDARITADSAIKDIATKAVEEVGKVAEEVEKYTDSINTLNIASINFVDTVEPLYRVKAEYSGSRYHPQGSTFFKNENGDIITCYFGWKSDGEAGHLVSYKNADKVSDLTVSMGHGNSMTYHNGYIYVSAEIATNTIYKVSITNNGVLGSVSVACVAPVGGSICHFDRLDKWYIASKTAINEIDITNGQIISTIAVDFDKYSNGGISNALNIFSIGTNDYVGKVYAQPNRYVIFDLNGNYITTKPLPDYIGWIPICEPESMRIDSEGNYTIVSAEPNLSDYMTKTAIMAYGNIFANGSSCNNIGRVQVSGNTLYIYCYPGSFQYSMPTVMGGGEITSSNQIRVSYLQDVQYILDRFHRKSAHVRIMESGCSKNALILAGVVANVELNDYTLSMIELRDGCYLVQDATTQFSSSKVDDTYNAQRIRVIECISFACANTIGSVASGCTALYTLASCIAIPAANNSKISTKGSCLIINPAK